MKHVGLSYCELWSGHVERADRIPVPEGGNRREATRQWRLERAVDGCDGSQESFDDAGVTLTSYDLPFGADFTDEEIARVFEMGKALGVEVITSSARVSLAPRLQPFAAKAGMQRRVSQPLAHLARSSSRRRTTSPRR